jgi:UDP-N-acetylglucosamine 2-epimerase (non-hydrolysing)
MKLSIILGTRPEIIKLCSIVRYCEEQKLDYFIIHTNQHYSENMDKIFFEALNLPKPKYNLNIGSGTHGKQTGLMLEKIEEVLIQEKPDIVLVQGDTNTVMAGALAACKLHIKIGHVEAGLRSYDKRMPEEYNRIVTDHISDYLFAPTDNQKNILMKEGIEEKKIFVVGNTIVDAAMQNIKISEKKDYLKLFNLKSDNYFLITVHRAENTDKKEILINIFKAFEEIYRKYKVPLFYPIHPRTKKMIDEYNIKLPEGLKIVEPVGYLEFLQLIKNAKAVLTDSGGVQEEACILKTPCVTIRDNTERPETVDVGANIIAGTTKEGIIKAVEIALKLDKKWINPLGNGKSGKSIIEILKDV